MHMAGWSEMPTDMLNVSAAAVFDRRATDYMMGSSQLSFTHACIEMQLPLFFSKLRTHMSVQLWQQCCASLHYTFLQHISKLRHVLHLQ